MSRLTARAVSLAALIAAPLPASALTVDFTEAGLFNVDATETYDLDGNDVTVSLSSNGTLTFTAFDGDNSVADLAFDYDGVGVGDDEITNGGEEVTVSFSVPVLVRAFSFLDLYRAQNDQDYEVALVYLNGDLVHSFDASVFFQQEGGFLFAAVDPLMADELVFRAASGNDDVGQADYALAALDIAPVPLPAALPLFASGVGLLGVFGWRRRRSSAP